ncbi:hypothetical protein C0Q70_10274 [Pomacea canaliculata]|uniref:oleoyl-[acyl-carrier-protein] hydrolase n=1 Tax=Pomacea canaliculata TaxID=400727 RepID=A0A2T7PC59_POMCA|nr:hypothetical protein C0Q70_10274 [Pomacea canaliculata]
MRGDLIIAAMIRSSLDHLLATFNPVDLLLAWVIRKGFDTFQALNWQDHVITIVTHVREENADAEMKSNINLTSHTCSSAQETAISLLSTLPNSGLSPWIQVTHVRHVSLTRNVRAARAAGLSRGQGTLILTAIRNLLKAVFGVTLRGRESRFAETPCVSATETVAEIASTIHSEYGEKPVILFGHSMGALLCFQTAVFLKTVYGKEPQHLYLSGISAPHTESRRRESKDLSTTSDEEFEQYVKELGGTPPEILENQDLFKLFLPTLKADFTIVNQIVSEPPDGHPPLSCPITFFDGAEDNVHDYEEVFTTVLQTSSLSSSLDGRCYKLDITQDSVA